MKKFEWTEKIKIGIAGIDEEHKRLIILHNEFLEAVKEHASPKTLHWYLKGLLTATSHHFTSEEALMRAKGYPRLNHHKEIHNRLKRDLNDFLIRFDRDPVRITETTLRFVHSWLVDHIKSEDTLFSVWIEEKAQVSSETYQGLEYNNYELDSEWVRSSEPELPEGYVGS